MSVAAGRLASRPLAGTGAMLRLALRRDRVILPLWIVVFAGMVTFSAQATMELYPTAASRAAAVESLNGTPALVALYGYVYSSSIGALSLLKTASTAAAFLAVLAFMLVVRHTRTEEEAGRLELVGATAVGRRAPLTAGLAVGIGTSVIIGTLSAAGLIAVGLPATGSIAFGLAWAATGSAFAAVGALAAQLTTGGRAATGIAAAFLGLTYVLRAVGDVTGEDRAGWISWLSPIGWEQQVRPFAEERWPVLLLLVAFTVLVSGAAFILAGRRDLGAGLLADRPGRSAAGSRLSGSWALAWRLQRGTLIAWMAAVGILGAVVGSIASQIGGMMDSPEARDFITELGGTSFLTDAFLALELGMMGSIVAVFGMQAAMRMRSEETAWRADLALATTTGRTRWMAGHAIVALAGTAGILLVTGLGVGAGHSLQVGDAGEMGRVVAGALVQIPAAWVMVGVVVAVFGIFPRATAATWGVLVAFLLLGEFGGLFEFPGWLMDLSPFAHTPRVPGGEVEAGQLAGLTVVAFALIGVGAVAFRRRDIAAG